MNECQWWGFMFYIGMVTAATLSCSCHALAVHLCNCESAPRTLWNVAILCALQIHLKNNSSISRLLAQRAFSQSEMVVTIPKTLCLAAKDVDCVDLESAEEKVAAALLREKHLGKASKFKVLRQRIYGIIRLIMYKIATLRFFKHKNPSRPWTATLGATWVMHEYYE